jgi:surface polysaccharide O-acyltransferase-like enzyme
MRNIWFLIAAIIVFVVMAIIAFTNGTWDTSQHLFGLIGIGSACFAASFVPVGGRGV